jgi:putative acetyltransferase
MDVREGGLDHPDVVALLQLHFDDMLAHSPCGSCHFLDLSALAAPDVRFWTMWDGDVLLGCGALKTIGEAHGEIKSMRTAPGALRRGVARALLDHIMAAARTMGLTRLSLETGTGPTFDPAHALYRANGFDYCPPFGSYEATDFNSYMTCVL